MLFSYQLDLIMNFLQFYLLDPQYMYNLVQYCSPEYYLIETLQTVLLGRTEYTLHPCSGCPPALGLQASWFVKVARGRPQWWPFWPLDVNTASKNRLPKRHLSPVRTFALCLFVHIFHKRHNLYSVVEQDVTFCCLKVLQ